MKLVVNSDVLFEISNSFSVKLHFNVTFESFCVIEVEGFFVIIFFFKCFGFCEF